MSLLEKINQLEEQKQKLEAQKRELIEKRKIQIGDLAIRLQLLDADDDLLLGAFAWLKQKLKTQDQTQIKEVKALAAPFRPKTKPSA